MNTKRLDIINGNYEIAINEAAELLKNGGIVAIPTETVYGLAASAFSDEAIKKVFIAKGRPQDNPLIVHVSDKEMLSFVADESDSRIKPIIESERISNAALIFSRSYFFSERE